MFEGGVHWLRMKGDNKSVVRCVTQDKCSIILVKREHKTALFHLHHAYARHACAVAQSLLSHLCLGRRCAGKVLEVEAAPTANASRAADTATKGRKSAFETKGGGERAAAPCARRRRAACAPVPPPPPRARAREARLARCAEDVRPQRLGVEGRTLPNCSGGASGGGSRRESRHRSLKWERGSGRRHCAPPLPCSVACF
jgi:hypothetical protein